jgi:hypothetical protein
MDTQKQVEKLRRKLEAAEQHRCGCTDDARRQRIAASMTQLRERLARLEKCIQAGGSSATAGSDGEAVGASQNATKKLEKRRAPEQWKAVKARKKAAAKARSAQRGAEMRAGLSEAECQAWRRQRKQQSLERQASDAARAERWAAAVASAPYTCVIDMGFEDKMTERECKSLAQQVLYAYGSNRRAEQPWKLALTSLQPGGLLARQLGKNCGFGTWGGFSCHEVRAQASPTSCSCSLVATHDAAAAAAAGQLLGAPRRAQGAAAVPDGGAGAPPHASALQTPRAPTRTCSVGCSGRTGRDHTPGAGHLVSGLLLPICAHLNRGMSNPYRHRTT